MKTTLHRWVRHGTDPRDGYAVDPRDFPDHHAHYSRLATMRPVVIALTGPAGCGKSTAAAYLAEKHGFARTRFAAPLKAMLGAFYASLGYTEDDILACLEGPRKELECPHLCGKTPRYAMQTIGTEWGREMMGRSLWVDAWRETACRALDEGGRVVVEDCRFEDEAETVRGLSGIVLRLEGRGGIAGDHVSEKGIDPDVRIWNDGTPEILHARLDGILDRTLGIAEAWKALGEAQDRQA